MLMKKYDLMQEANVDGGNGGSGGAGSTPFTLTGGGGSKAPQGNAGAQAPAGKEHKATGDNSAASATPSGNTDWKSSLPKELQEEPSLKLINDIPSLVKSYVNAQRLVGVDKIPVPSKHATDEDWRNVFGKLGLPGDVKEYDVKLKEGLTIDKEFTEAFKETAYKAGILPRQAQALADWFAQTNEQAESKLSEEFRKAQGQRIEGLKKEWGAAFESKVSGAQAVIRELNDPDFEKYLNDSGLTGEPALVKAFAAIHSKFFAESKEVGGKNVNDPVMTPKEAQAAIDSIMGNVATHPYFHKDHPGHKAAVAEMQQLFKFAKG